MRRRRYLTMLDPFQDKYGPVVGGLMYLPALSGDLFWSGAILSALGSSMAIIMDIPLSVAVIVSACIAVGYTFFGGLYSVAYTDVLQLLCMIFGLTLFVPFAWHWSPDVCWEPEAARVAQNVSVWTNDSCPSDVCFGVLYNRTLCTETEGRSLNETYDPNIWGTIPSDTIGGYIDLFLLIIFGGIPWQAFLQRCLAVDAPWKATALGAMGGVGCFIMSIPPAIIGIIARVADWDSAGYEKEKLLKDPLLVLPAVAQYLTPPVVAFFALGAISAAVMSSSDSSVLSASTLFAHNIYRKIFRPKASDTEVVIVLRVTVLVYGVLATLLALTAQSVYYLFILCSDLVYVILFPQLVAVMYMPFVNSYGVLAGFFLGLLFRLLGGEPGLGFPSTIPYGGNFPFKTFCMLLNLIATIIVSLIAKSLCATRPKFDLIGGFKERPVINREEEEEEKNGKYPMSGMSNSQNHFSTPVYPVYEGDFREKKEKSMDIY